MKSIPQVKKSYIIALIAIFSVTIFIVGYIYYNSERTAFFNSVYQELENTSHFKAEQISKFILTQRSVINSVSSSAFFVDGIKEYFNGSSNLNIENDINNRLKKISDQFGIDNIILADTTGKVIITLEPEVKNLSEFTISKIKQAIEKRKILFSDLYYSKPDEDIYFDFIAPLIDKESNVIAVLVFRCDPHKELYPVINYEPGGKQTLETIIVRLEKDSALFINNPRFNNDAAFKLKIPISKDAPAVEAALGVVGRIKGTDYRNEKVLAHSRKLNYPSWTMVSKIDLSEIDAAVLNKLYFIIAVCLGLTFTVGFGFVWLYNQRQKNIYKELYKKEKELWQQQEKFKVTLDSLGDGIIVTDTKNSIKYMNKMAEELTGWNLREAGGRMLSEVYSVKNEETGQRENNILEKVIKHGIVKELANHTILLSKNGKEYPVMDTGAPIFDIDGTLLGIAISFQDETKKRQQQKLIKESEHRLRSTLDNMLEGCQIIGNDWNYLYINKAAEKHNRRPSSELIGKNYKEMWPGIEQTTVFQNIKDCIENGVASKLENEFVFPDGTKGFFEVSIEPIPEGVLILSADITERKKTELEMLKAKEELYNSHLKIQLIIDNLNDLLWSASLDGSEILEVNDVFENFYGKSVKEFTDNPQLWIEMVHPDDKEIAIKSGEDLFRKGTAEAEYRIVKPDGSIKWILDRKSLLKDETGEPIGIGGLAKDITEQKLAVEEIIKAKDKAQEMNRLRSNFFANMSHELRTPFVGIIGYAEFLAQDLRETENGEFAEGILDSSQRLMETLNQILISSKLEFENQGINKKWFDVRNVIDRVHKNFLKNAATKKLELIKRINFSNYSIYTDEGLFETILSNLVNNALKFTNTGSVKICADIVKTELKETLRIEVIDTGIGIPKNKQDVIWEEFRQASEGLNRSFEGSGLGLSIVKNSVKELGGSISLESEEGKGSTFMIEIPIVKSDAVQAEPDNNQKNEILEVSSHKTKSRKKILYVEDDMVSRNIISKTLSEKHDIFLSANSDEAMEIVNKMDFDAILMDINLGKGIDGVELTQRIKRTKGYKEVPIIAVTAFASDDDREDFLSRGLDYYISKPFRQNDLNELLDQIFSERSA